MTKNKKIFAVTILVLVCIIAVAIYSYQATDTLRGCEETSEENLMIIDLSSDVKVIRQDGKLFVPQCFNWVQLAGFKGGECTGYEGKNNNANNYAQGREDRKGQ